MVVKLMELVYYKTNSISFNPNLVKERDRNEGNKGRECLSINVFTRLLSGKLLYDRRKFKPYTN